MGFLSLGFCMVHVRVRAGVRLDFSSAEILTRDEALLQLTVFFFYCRFQPVILKVTCFDFTTLLAFLIFVLCDLFSNVFLSELLLC